MIILLCISLVMAKFPALSVLEKLLILIKLRMMHAAENRSPSLHIPSLKPRPMLLKKSFQHVDYRHVAFYHHLLSPP